MFKANYYDTISPMSYEIEFETEREMDEWITTEMETWWEILCNEYPNVNACWINRYLDCGNVTEIYIPDTNIVIQCTIESTK